MSMSDPLADMLTRIRNATESHFSSVEMPSSNIKVNVAKVLKAEGYINDYSVDNTGKQKTLTVELKYGPHNEKVITGIKRVSKPGCRRYTSSREVPQVMSGLGIAILTTSQGVITDKEARLRNIGGEILCEVW
ncbi:MAG: 30S ribosomal protein S8 [Desulfobulbus sp.]|jgi:small subunit ribosomal protein S8